MLLHQIKSWSMWSHKLSLTVTSMWQTFQVTGNLMQNIRQAVSFRQLTVHVDCTLPLWSHVTDMVSGQTVWIKKGSRLLWGNKIFDVTLFAMQQITMVSFFHWDLKCKEQLGDQLVLVPDVWDPSVEQSSVTASQTHDILGQGEWVKERTFKKCVL